MCGIIGVISKTSKRLSNPSFDVFTNMLVADAVRGRDSTGVFSINDEKNVDIIKIASHPFNLLATTEWNTWRTNAWRDGQVLVGHNRRATEGSIKNVNAHPFSSGPIVLVHNGHISNFKTLVPIKTRTKHEIEVDSHGLAYLLSSSEPEKVFKEIRGAYAIVWYNATQKKLSLIRNSERPLAMMESDDSFYFASEGSMLKWILKRNNVKAKGDVVGQIKEHTLININLDSHTLEYKDFEIIPIPPVIPVFQNHMVANDDDDDDDETGAILRRAWNHRRQEVHNEETKDASYLRNPSFTDIPEDKKFNIYYGGNRPITVEDDDYQQIVWTIENYKLLKSESNGNNIYMIEGTALNSTNVQCRAGIILKSHDDIEKLACQPHVISFIRRVRKDWVWVKSQKHSSTETRQAGTVVTVSGTMPIELVPYSTSKIMLTKEHAEHLMKTPACICDPEAKYGNKDPDGMAEYDPNNNKILFQCSWCKAADLLLEVNGT